MKLIDAYRYRHELLQRFDNARRWKEKAIKANAEQKIIIRAETAINIIAECLECLKEQPEIDYVKYAKWLDNGANYECSNCGHTEGYYDMRYCPNCGAKME